MLSFKKFIVEEVKDLSEEVEQLDEAVTSFNALPGKWKAVATKAGFAGKDSSVTVHPDNRKVRTEAGFKSILRHALEGPAGTLTWVELNGEPLVAVVHNSYEKTVQLLYPSGEYFVKNVKFKADWSDKWVRTGPRGSGQRRYVPPQYFDHTEKSLKLGEAVDTMWRIVFDTLKEVNSGLKTTKDLVDLAKEMDFKVKSLTPDATRAEKQAERKGNRALIQTQKSGQADAGIVANRKAVLTKFVRAKLDPAISAIKSDIEAQVDVAINGGKFDLAALEANLRKIGSISKSLQSAIAKENLRFTERSGWRDDGKAKVSWDMKYLMADLDKINEK